MLNGWHLTWNPSQIVLKKKDSGTVWHYKLTTPPYCNECGRSLILRKICWDSERHKNLELAKKTFQMGYYFPYAKLEFQDESDILSQHILNMKSDHQLAELIGTAMAMTIINNYKELLDADILVPAPSFGTVDNHSYALCKIISEHLKQRMNVNTLVNNAINKVKDITLHQLPTREEREDAVNGMFVEHGSISVMAKDVILIDDLLTTGDTKRECIRILKENGAKRVWVYVAAGNV